MTGLTSNPTIFDKAIKESNFYDEAIHGKAAAGKSGEELFFDLALEDLTRAADLFRPVHDATGGIDGWVSLEVSPLLADDTGGTIEAAGWLHWRRSARISSSRFRERPPGTLRHRGDHFRRRAGERDAVVLAAISTWPPPKAISAASNGASRPGSTPRLHSVASIFVSRWDNAVQDKVAAMTRNRLGIAIARRTYRAYRELLASPRWRKLAHAGAHPQRLLWASTGTKDPKAPDTLYVEALAAPDTVNTMPEATLLAYADHGHVPNTLPADGGNCETVLERFASAGIDTGKLAGQLQLEGAEDFVKILERSAAVDRIEGECRRRHRRSLEPRNHERRNPRQPSLPPPPAYGNRGIRFPGGARPESALVVESFHQRSVAATRS